MNPLAKDTLNRPLQDLRISLTDRCNLRCNYCMPAEIFGAKYPYLPHAEILSYEEITQLAGIFTELGVKKIRLTGGEPLLRRNVSTLVAMLRHKLPDLDLALTTNAILLAPQAAQLAKAGLSRVNISMDALDPYIFKKMSGNRNHPNKVIQGIEAAQKEGLHIKLNMVVQRSINEHEILPMLEFAQSKAVQIRFIEYMDVGNSNEWNAKEVFTAREILSAIETQYKPRKLPEPDSTSPARHYTTDGGYTFGIIASVSQPFCGSCVRARLSADGKLYTCLFSNAGHDLKAILRNGPSSSALRKNILTIWNHRNDRYSEQRHTKPKPKGKVEMSYIGG